MFVWVREEGEEGTFTTQKRGGRREGSAQVERGEGRICTAAMGGKTHGSKEWREEGCIVSNWRQGLERELSEGTFTVKRLRDDRLGLSRCSSGPPSSVSRCE